MVGGMQFIVHVHKYISFLEGGDDFQLKLVLAH